MPARPLTSAAPQDHARAWMRWSLLAAAAYNALWGAAVIAMPARTLALLGAADAPPIAAPIWQSVGMIVGMYGLGYALAARDPLRHWPIVLVGFVGKLLGPIGFVQAAFIDRTLPPRFGLTILTNDLLWWVPFALILLAARRAHSPANGARLDPASTGAVDA